MRKLGYQRIEHWQKFTQAFDAQEKILKSKSVRTIFDVGGNVGQTAEAYRRHFPQAVVHSFEPFPDSFEKLYSRSKGDALIKSHQMALSNREGVSQFHVNKGPATNSLLAAAPTGDSWCPRGLLDSLGTIQVKTSTIDHFCHQHQVSHIDILKMDAQGGELMILEGASDMLKRKAISLIYSEVLFVPIYDGQAYFHQLCSYLADYHYRFFDLFSCRYSENGQLKWADAIFLQV